MIRYGVIDTNVLVSAVLNRNSVPGLVLKHVFGGNLVPVFNDKILEEYREVLHRKKFPFSEEDVRIVLESLKEDIKHFPKEPFVVTPREMLEILEENDS